MFSENDIRNLQGATAYCSDGNKIGRVGEVYLDDQSGQPEWVTVNTGLFGTKTSFAPLDGASLDGDRLNLNYPKDVVTGAPKVDEDGHLSEQEEAELYRYYQRDVSTTDVTTDVDQSATNVGVGVAGTGLAGDRDRGVDVDRSVDVDRDRTAGDAEVTLSEERLNVGTQSAEVGKARLRKYVTTEEQTVTVPVQKERLVVEREAVNEQSGGRIDADAGTDEVITLREERPVVSTETVDVEKVRVGKETVTENETVSGTVRKEHVDIEGDADTTTGGERKLTDRDGDGKGFVEEIKDRLDGDKDPNR